MPKSTMPTTTGLLYWAVEIGGVPADIIPLLVVPPGPSDHGFQDYRSLSPGTGSGPEPAQVRNSHAPSPAQENKAAGLRDLMAGLHAAQTGTAPRCDRPRACPTGRKGGRSSGGRPPRGRGTRLARPAHG